MAKLIFRLDAPKGDRNSKKQEAAAKLSFATASTYFSSERTLQIKKAFP